MSVHHGESVDHPYASVHSRDGVTGYVSGVLPYEDDGSIARDRDRACERVVEVLAQRLEAAGFGLEDVVKTTVFLLDLDWRSAVNRVWFDRFTEPRPARTAVQVSRLPGDSGIEVEAIVTKQGG